MTTKNFSFKENTYTPTNKETSLFIPKKMPTMQNQVHNPPFETLSSLNNKDFIPNSNIHIEKDNEDSIILTEREEDDGNHNISTRQSENETDEILDIKKVYYSKFPNICIDKLENPWKYPKTNEQTKHNYLDNNNISQSFFGDFSNNNTLNITSNKKELEVMNSIREKGKNQLNTKISGAFKDKETINEATLKIKRLEEIKRQRTNISQNQNENTVVSYMNKSSNYGGSGSNSDNESRSDYDGISSASDFELNEINTFSNDIYTLNKIERTVIPKAIEFYIKINQHGDHLDNIDFGNHFNSNNISQKDIFKRYAKLLDKTMLIYQSEKSQQMLISIDLIEAYIELGPTYKIDKKDSNKMKVGENANEGYTQYFSFNIYSSQKCYTFYTLSEQERDLWIKSINKSIGFSDINDLFTIKKLIYKTNTVTIEKAVRKADGHISNVVIKTIKKQNLSKEKIESINTESTILRTYKHPYILKFIEKFENKDNYFIVNEFCKGFDLGNYLKQRNFKISEAHACKIIFQLCCAVAYIHSYNTLHRNIKLENIYMTDSTEYADIRLSGFNICIFLHKDKSYDYKGTLKYIAPEVLLKKNYSFSSDIWSIGVVAHVLLTGSYPFEGCLENEIADSIINKQLTFQKEVWRGLSRESQMFVASKYTNYY